MCPQPNIDEIEKKLMTNLNELTDNPPCTRANFMQRVERCVSLLNVVPKGDFLQLLFHARALEIILQTAFFFKKERAPNDGFVRQLEFNTLELLIIHLKALLLLEAKLKSLPKTIKNTITTDQFKKIMYDKLHSYFDVYLLRKYKGNTDAATKIDAFNFFSKNAKKIAEHCHKDIEQKPHDFSL